jgi:hypothetical protein
MRSFLIFLLSSIFLVLSCSKESNDTPCDISNINYEGTIKALFSSCAIVGCHNSGATAGSLANYTDAKTMGLGGKLLGALKHQASFTPMPQGAAKWNDCDISKVENWIDAGFPEK